MATHATPPALHIMFYRVSIVDNGADMGRSRSCRPHISGQQFQTGSGVTTGSGLRKLAEIFEDDCAGGVLKQAASPSHCPDAVSELAAASPETVALQDCNLKCCALEHNASRSMSVLQTPVVCRTPISRLRPLSWTLLVSLHSSRIVVPPSPPPLQGSETSGTVCRNVCLPHRHGLVVRKSTRSIRTSTCCRCGCCGNPARRHCIKSLLGLLCYC